VARKARSPSVKNAMSWSIVAAPTNLARIDSSAGATTKKVGQAAGGNFLTAAALTSRSVSRARKTKRRSCSARRSSRKTVAFIDRQVWHHGAHMSMTRGTPFSPAQARALS
jgi:hypothetical protein